jgi:hypothetical protein
MAEKSIKWLDEKIVNGSRAISMLGVEVIDDPLAAAVALDPVRSRLLSELAEPALDRDT